MSKHESVATIVVVLAILLGTVAGMAAHYLGVENENERCAMSIEADLGTVSILEICNPGR